MAPGDSKCMLGQQPPWRGNTSETGVYGVCLIAHTGLAWEAAELQWPPIFPPGRVAVSPGDEGFQAVPLCHSIKEYLLQRLGPRKREKPPGPPLPREP